MKFEKFNKFYSENIELDSCTFPLNHYYLWL